jgi:hypothetical protein
MKYVDRICAGLIFLAGVAHIVATDILHLPGSLDTALVWILVAMLNLLRILNGYPVRGLKVFCLGGNVAVLVLEVVRWKMFAGPSSLVLIVLFVVEILFSISTKA